MRAAVSRKAPWIRFAVAVLLLGAIFHVIFCNEAQLHLAVEGGTRWEELTRWEQRRLAWSRGPVELWRTTRRLSPGSVVLAGALCGLPIVLGGFRWRRVLQVQGIHPGIKETLRISFVAHFFNAFLLGSTGGDVVKAWYAARLAGPRRAEAALSVFVDRLLGTLALLVFAVAMLPFCWEVPAEGGMFRWADYRRYVAVVLLVGGMLAVAGGLAFIGFHTDALRAGAPVSRWLARLPRGESVARALSACRLFGRTPGFLPSVAALSLLVNVAIVGTFLVLARDLELEVPLRVLVFVVPAVICVAALPVTPSGLGVRENLFVALLALPVFPGVKPAEALSLSLLGYTANLAWSAFGGLVYLLMPGRHTVVPHGDDARPAD